MADDYFNSSLTGSQIEAALLVARAAGQRSGLIKSNGSGTPGGITAAEAGNDYGYPVLVRNTDPISTTVGAVSQLYISTATTPYKMFICVSASVGNYTWVACGADISADLQAEIDRAQLAESQLQALILARIIDPSIPGTSGQVLATDGNGGTYWKTVSGGGGGGTDDYNDLAHKPKINDVELSGNVSLSTLGINIPTALSELTDDLGSSPTHTHNQYLQSQDISGKADKGISFSVTLSVAGWSSGAQVVNNAYFQPSGYAYIITPKYTSRAAWNAADISVEDVTTANACRFHCETVPTSAITVNVTRLVVS